MIKEYTDVDIPKEINFKDIKKIKNGVALLKSNKNLTTLTPPLKCENIKVWKNQKTNEVKKFELSLILTQNEWRFTNFLTEVSDHSKNSIRERTQSYLFSDKILTENYKNLFTDSNLKEQTETIRLQVREKMSLELIKSYKNKYVSLMITFKGIIISNGIFQEIWKVEKIHTMDNDDDSDYDYDLDDVSENISHGISHNLAQKMNRSENIIEKKVKEQEEEISQSVKDNEKVEEDSSGNPFLLSLKKKEEEKIEEEEKVEEEKVEEKVEEEKVEEKVEEEKVEKKRKEKVKKPKILRKNKKKRKIKIRISGGRTRCL